MTRKNMIMAIIASTIVSAPVAFLSLTIVQVDGGWIDLLSHPGFWGYFARACGWYFLAGFLASALTLFLTTKNRAQT